MTLARRLAGLALLGLSGLIGSAGCIRAPAIVLVDRATALEQQAGGSFTDLEKKLARATLEPRPVALTPEQLESLGIPPPQLVDQTERTDADRVDDLLKQRCVGEARDGTLHETFDACRGAADRGQTIALIERTNAARLQLWRWMKERKPEASAEDLRRAWWQAHIKGVVCGGWIQRDDGGWEAKKC